MAQCCDHFERESWTTHDRTITPRLCHSSVWTPLPVARTRVVSGCVAVQRAEIRTHPQTELARSRANERAEVHVKAEARMYEMCHCFETPCDLRVSRKAREFRTTFRLCQATMPKHYGSTACHRPADAFQRRVPKTSSTYCSGRRPTADSMALSIWSVTRSSASVSVGGGGRIGSCHSSTV